MAWLPQETILFDRARLRRTIEVDLAARCAPSARRGLIFGRSGMGETVADGFLLDRWRVRGPAGCLHAGDRAARRTVAATLAQSGRKGGVSHRQRAVGSRDDAIVAAVRAASHQYRGEVGASAWNGLAAVRLVAADGAALRHDLACVSRHHPRRAAAAALGSIEAKARDNEPDPAGKRTELLISPMAAMVARRRLERGVKLNHPEAVALITDFILAGAA